MITNKIETLNLFYSTLYDVTLGRVRVTIVAVEKQWVLHVVSVCL